MSVGAYAATATTTTLTASSNTPYVGQAITLTAKVTGSSPTGTITFKDGTTSLGTATLSAGQATLSASFTTSGTHSLTAVYGGDTANATSTSSAVSAAVKAKTTSTTALSSGINPSNVNQSVTLTATVTGTSPSGTVTFKDGTAVLGTATIATGKATLTTSFTTSGSHSLTAVYAGDTANSSSTSSAVTQTVNLLTTTTTLASSLNPAYVAQSVTLTATVSGTSPTGTVSFKDGTTTLGTTTLSAGQATLATSFSTAATHSLTAVYAGDSVNKTSTSAAVSEAVKAQVTTTTALASNATTVLVNQSVTLTATVAGTSPSGVVTFKDGTTVLGSGTVSAGKATLTTNFGTAGTHSVTAVYGGDTVNATSTSSAVTETVNQATTTTTLTSSSNPAYVGQNVILTATVSGGTNTTGTVTFKDGTTTLGTASLSSGQATLATSFSTAAAHSLTAVYGGDSVNKTSTSAAVNETVNAKVTTTTALASGTNPALVNQSVTLTATVTGTSPSGSVTFKDGTTVLGSAAVSAGKAVLNASFATTGSHSLTAVYAGDTANNTSTSSALTQTVNINPTSTTLASSANPVATGQTVTLSATISGSNPSGNVTFKDGTTTLGTSSVASGQASLNVSFSAAGTHSLTAVYAGDTANATSTSTALSESVFVKSTTTTTLTSSTPTAYVGVAVTLSAKVTGSSPSGNVTFSDGSNVLGTAAVSAGTASLSTSFASVGNHSLTATYAGDGANAGSTSGAITQAVQLYPATTTLSSATNPATVGQNVALSVSIGGNNATGTVTIKDGAVTLGTTTVTGGTGTFNASFTSAGTHSLTAVYAGDAANAGSTSAVLSQTVNLNASKVALASSSSSPAIGQSVTLTATVSGSSPTGTITFLDGTSTLGTAALAAGVATLNTTFAAAGSHALTAVYGGDAANASSTSAAFTQSVGPASSNIGLTSSVNPATLSQAVTLTATVTGSNPSGSVTFLDGGNAVGSATLNNGQATFALTFSGVGNHTLTASYGGDTNNTASTTSGLNQVVSQASSGTTLNVSSNSVVIGSSVTLGAVVSGSGPTGTVNFLDGTTVLGSAQLSNGQAAFTVTLASLGAHSLTASYLGDASNAASVSAITTVNVNNPAVSALGPLTWQYGYDALGNRTNITDPNGAQTDTVYDGLSRPVTITMPQLSSDAQRASVTLQSDGLDQRTRVTDLRSLQTSYTVNGLGHTQSLTSPDTGASTATYDAAGNLRTRTDARGKQTVYGYDRLNRLTSLSYPTGAPTTLEYDGGANPTPNELGQLTLMSDESGNTAYSHDAFGRTLSKVQTGSSAAGTRTLSVGYSWGSSGYAAGKLTSITYPSGLRVNYGYDGTGRVSSVSVDPVNTNGVGTSSGATVPLLGAIGYTGANDINGWTWGNGSVYSRSYDANGRLLSYSLGDAGGSGASAGVQRTIAWDNAMRVTGFTHNNVTGNLPQLDQSFGYDSFDRLLSATLGGTSYGFSHDLSGNRTAQVVGGLSMSNTVDVNSNRLTQVQVPNGASALSVPQGYDVAGNVTDGGHGVATISDRGRLSRLTLPAGVVNYLHNGLEQRVVKVGPVTLVPTGAAYYAYDESGRVLGEYDANLVPVYETVYTDVGPVAVVKQDRSTQVVQTQVNYVYADQIGTPRVITRNSDNAIVWRWDQAEPFGATPPDQNPNGLGVFAYNQRMPGQVYDAESATFYNWHRTYDPATGRYLQSDPIGLSGGLNTYAYVGGNPIGFVDPFGLCQCTAVPGSKESKSIPRWYGHDREVKGKYTCETDDKKKDVVVGTHGEWYMHKDTADTGREGNLLGQQYGTATFNSYTYTYTYPQDGFASFDPLTSPSPELQAWGKRCKCK